MLNRTNFEQRIARAIQAGQRKAGRDLTDKQAAERARQVADALPALLQNETGELVSKTADITAVSLTYLPSSRA